MQAVSQLRIRNIEPVAMTPRYRHNKMIIKQGIATDYKKNIENTKIT